VIRNGLAAMLGLSERQVRVVAPAIGGGFGPKIMMFYPEEMLIPWAARHLDRPVKWIEDRLEHFFATTHERGQLHEAELALDAEGRILGVQDDFLFDTGAYNPYGLTIPLNSQCTLLGCYDVPAYDSRFRAVFTNRTLVTPYRGAGRQHGVFVMERLLDLAAHEIGLDRAEIRRRNFIPPDAFPYNNQIIYQDFAPLTVCHRLDAVQLCRLDQCHGNRPVPGTAIIAREQGVLAGDRDRPDDPLDDVGVHLDPAVIEIDRQPRPVPQRIADGVRQIRGGRDTPDMLLQPGMQGLHD
jgi:hypothetical protein